MNLYNTDFDFVAIILYIIAIISYMQKKHVNRKQHKAFLALLWTSFVTPVTDILACCFIEWKYPFAAVQAINIVYYISKNATTFFFLVYTISLAEFRFPVSRLKKIMMYAPILIFSVLLLINPVTGWNFTYVDGEYHSGVLRPVGYFVSIFYFLGVFTYVAKVHSILQRKVCNLVYVLIAINISVELVQYFYSSLLIHSLVIAASIVMLTMNIEHYSMTVDSVTGMASLEHFELIVSKYFLRKRQFRVLLVKMKNYDAMVSSIGVMNINSLISETQKRMLSITSKGSVFKFENDLYAVLLDKEDDSKIKEKMIYDEISRAVLICGVEISADFNVTTLDFPEYGQDVETVLEFINYFHLSSKFPVGILKASELQIKDKIREKKISNAIERGLSAHNFKVVYQPICTANDRKFVTAEALLRLNDPELGSISPEEFIPIAEQNGAIIEIGNYVLDSVCSFIEKHNMEELGLEYIEMNLSTIQCMQSNFMEIVDEVTKRHNIQSKYLCFEITETASEANQSIFTQNLSLLNERGYSLALDDFGTGYGNLQRMISSDFKIIKFDKNMIQRLSGDKLLRNVYKKLHSVIKSLGSTVVSEGVETKEQYEFVRDAGCHYIQGFYFSKPLEEEAFCDFLKSSR